MPMKPNPGEEKSKFVSRCISEMSDAHPDWENDQLVAACNSMWGDKDKKSAKQIAPDEDEDRVEFLERCQSAGNDLQECELAWEERKAPEIKHRAHVSTAPGFEFVLSDATPDRMGDVIIADGWDLENFRKNPIALFNHKADFPIGKWKNLRVHGDALRGHLELAPKGSSTRIDEIRALIDAGILKAVSVGFRPIQSEPRKSGGEIFHKQELVETSLVAIPANPNALAVAKSLKISPRTIDLVFAGQGNKKNGNGNARGVRGGQAETPPERKNRKMSPLTKRIEDTEQRIVRLRDDLEKHLEKVDDENPGDTDIVTTQEYNKKIEDQQSVLASLRDSETRLAKTSEDHSSNGNGNGNGGGNGEDTTPSRTIVRSNTSRPFGVMPKKRAPLDYLVYSGVVSALAHIKKMPYDVVRKEIYGDDEAVKAICDLTLKAASAPAMTTVAGWAQELVQQINEGLMERLQPSAVFPALSGMGLKLSFGRNGRILIPTRAATPTVAGSFVGEGAAIPVRQAAFASQTLVPKKMAVITTWTREMDEHSVPAIEGLLRDAIQQDTAVSIDNILLDNITDSAIRPHGLRWNPITLAAITGLTPTAGGGFTALVGDLKQLTGSILTATNGNIRNMVFIMNPQQALSIAYIQPPNPGGLFPFAADINAGTLAGARVIKSGTVPLTMVICMDAADFVSVSGDTPRFEISDQATLHMEDSNPLPISSLGTPPTVAAPARSLWQTDSLALRLILPMNWIVRRSNVVSWVTGVTW